MFVEVNKSFIIYLIIIVTFKFFNHNVKIFIDFAVNNKNNRRIVVLLFLFKWAKNIRNFIDNFEIFRQ